MEPEISIRRVCVTCARYAISNRMVACSLKTSESSSMKKERKINESQRLYEIKACNLEMDWDSTMSRGYQMDG